MYIAYDTTPDGSGDILASGTTRNDAIEAAEQAGCDINDFATAEATPRLAAALNAKRIVRRWQWTDGCADLGD